MRTSSDQRSVDSSPRLIAASYVLHRLLVPRHPPCALNNLATHKHRTTAPGRTPAVRGYKNSAEQSHKMLASTVQFSTYDQTPATRPHQTHPVHGRGQRYERQTGPDMSEQATPPQGRVRSLRTQQRAYDPPHRDRLRSTPPRPKTSGPYWEPATAGGRTGQRSTLEHHPTRSAG